MKQISKVKTNEIECRFSKYAIDAQPSETQPQDTTESKPIKKKTKKASSKKEEESINNSSFLETKTNRCEPAPRKRRE